MARRVLVVGAGIIGVCLARELATVDGLEVTVVERDLAKPRGSTRFAPGFVGLYNSAAVLTDLARTSAQIYDAAGEGFDRPGGLELSVSDSGTEEIERRVAGAREVGLPADLLTAAQLPASVTRFVDSAQVAAAGSFWFDGVAVLAVLTRTLRTQASAVGAIFLTGRAVTGFDTSGQGGHVVELQDGTRLPADDVILAGGVWGSRLADLADAYVPLFPVAHPYVYSAPATDHSPGPFVRWPERHVYARVHTDRLGIGSYDHAPIPLDHDDLDGGAGLPWDERFDEVISSAQTLLRPGARLPADRRVNGVFAMTPDNLPYLGAHADRPGMWTAQGLWITHAAGAARALARAMTTGSELPPELAVDRFGSPDEAGRRALRGAALRLYRDIYANDSPSEDYRPPTAGI